jgi:2,4-dienoyl-CoA reductase-like NADH-dependent reductase (Old Yellow Enzyme family)
VALNEEFTKSFRSEDTAGVTGIEDLLERLERDEFDLVAVGRSLIVNPDFAAVVQRGNAEALKPFQRDVLAELV